MPNDDSKAPQGCAESHTVKHLAGVRHDEAGKHFYVRRLRNLTDTEIHAFEKFTSESAAAENRFRLFRILHQNYVEWSRFLQALNHAMADRDEMGELDRLMLNYLSAARALIDHFRQYYSRTFKGAPQKADFNDLIERLKISAWPFAFFQDFRNFVQHCGLPIGALTKHSVPAGIQVQVQVNAEWLIQNYNGWQVCGLNASYGKLDLVKLADDYHGILTGTIGRFLAGAYFGKLVPAHNFFAVLWNEVRAAAPDHDAVLLPELTTKKDGGKVLDLTWTPVRPNLLGDFGFQVIEIDE